jgi:hypothetical protein
MAVFEGVRLRSTALPAADTAIGRTRVTATASLRPAPRMRPIGVVLAAIVMATMLGMVYLTQTLGSNATSAEIIDLESRQEKLSTELGRHVVFVEKSTEDEHIIEGARRLGLRRLDGRVVLRAP